MPPDRIRGHRHVDKYLSMVHDGHMTTTRALASEVTPDVANIVRTFRAATNRQFRQGMEWYAGAHDIAMRLDPSNVERAAGVLAALSPRLDWGKNIELAVRAYNEGQTSGCLKTNGAKADAILNGAAPLDVLGGDKVRNFYGTIVNPLDVDAVVIDRHAFDVAIGRVTDDETRKVLSRKGVYDEFANAYRAAGRIVGASPSQVQSVTWIVWRETTTKYSAANTRKAAA